MKKHSQTDLVSRLKTRKILGVGGEDDDGEVHRSKVGAEGTWSQPRLQSALSTRVARRAAGAHVAAGSPGHGTFFWKLNRDARGIITKMKADC